MDIWRTDSRTFPGDNAKRGVDSLAGETYGNCVQVVSYTCNIVPVLILIRLIHSELRLEKRVISAQERLGAENADYTPWQLFLLAQLKTKEIKTEEDVEMNAFYRAIVLKLGNCI